ncbi:unnamed protein product [Triticum turgidum subsp. durum]|uniref:NB-ARC domain-containing protein n=1 Tax=Triticum turgidum subsp. durum TaxID=4567 RepID=A0A9R0WYS8_TRITD|nr:unnamed protein product [Triticum turgidum subsp. durum]
MKPLSGENSKRLFFSRTFGDDQSVLLDKQYDEMSKKILWRCGGVPLSITTIASLLAGKRREAWSEVYESIGFGHEKNEAVENTRKIMSFSYYDLPSCLKTCLLHLRIFPEDTTFGKKTLIWMWIAEGFIIDKPGTQLFELGESYLNELVNRNMIQQVEPRHMGSLSGCSVHDMVYDLICSLSSQVNFITIYDKHQQAVTFSRVRRLAIHRGSMEQINPGMEMGHVKSFNAVEWRNIRMPSLLSFRALRVLVFFKCGFSTGSCDLKHVRKLVHLRYLGLVDTPAVELPKDIGHDLNFLQTLDVRGSGIKELPPTIGELTKLMCLRASKGTRFTSEIGKLTSLVELDLSSADKSAHLFTQLGNLREVRTLNIWFEPIDESCRHKDLVGSLGSMRRLQQLRVGFHSAKEILVDGWEEWTPPSLLRELGLYHILLPRRPLWLDSSCVPLLSTLRLELEVVSEQDMQILGTLPSLRHLYLQIYKMKVFSYTVGSDEFQKLRHLKITVEIMTCGEGVLPMLEELRCCATVRGKGGFGLMPGNMPCLQHVTYELNCQHSTADEVEEAEIAMRYMAQIHPNHPTLEIERINEDYAGPAEVSAPHKEVCNVLYADWIHAYISYNSATLNRSLQLYFV